MPTPLEAGRVIIAGGLLLGLAIGLLSGHPFVGVLGGLGAGLVLEGLLVQWRRVERHRDRAG